jgi:hypothetical protein
MGWLQKLEYYQKQFDGLNGQDLSDESRKKLAKLVKDAQNKGGFYRKDENKTVNLYHLKESMLHGMAADISVGITEDYKIWVCDDGLWGTMTGYYEKEAERKAYTSQHGDI